MNIDLDLLDDDLSSAMGTEILLAHDLVPEGLPASRKACGVADTPYWRGKIPGSRQTANRRQGSKISKIWLHNRSMRVVESVVEQWFDQEALD